MHASVRPALSVNIPASATSPAARETSAALSMRMTISKVNFFYGPKQTLFDGQNILTQDVTSYRRRVGMVFQRPNPFPKSIFDNVAYGLRINGSKAPISEAVEKSLRHAALWDEVKDHLHKSAYELSGGQQQRLCIARGLAVEPEVLLLDEPCSALDPISTAKIEELLVQLKDSCTIAIVTHNMQQAARVSDYTAFLLVGQLVEFNPTPQLFTT